MRIWKCFTKEKKKHEYSNRNWKNLVLNPVCSNTHLMVYILKLKFFHYPSFPSFPSFSKFDFLEKYYSLFLTLKPPLIRHLNTIFSFIHQILQCIYYHQKIVINAKSIILFILFKQYLRHKRARRFPQIFFSNTNTG